MNHRRNLVVKKLWRYGAAVPRAILRLTRTPASHAQRPPVLVNSFPKSGTHLLVQALSVIPGLRDWGDFWASQPSFTFREQSPRQMKARIDRVAPGELVCGHLHHSNVVARALQSRRIAHFFIYRDPRDVVVSEAHYLAHMNRWHRLHAQFRQRPTAADRLLLSIEGLPEGRLAYPNVAARFARFAPWLDRADVCAINYEDLISERRDETLARIFGFYGRHVGHAIDVAALVRAAQAAIQPARSHTFRRGGRGGWRGEFDARARAAFARVGGEELLVRLGYEPSTPA